MNSRDSSILRHMVGYCQQIQKSVERFGDSFEVFQADPDYKNSVALCVLQIGELSGQLSEGFKDTHREIPWREIKAMRNVVAHRYGTIDTQVLFETVQNDIPALLEYCETLLQT